MTVFVRIGYHALWNNDVQFIPNADVIFINKNLQKNFL
jgi:hypothetical protein